MLKETSKGVILPVKIIPKAHKNEIIGWENGELKIKVRAVPEKGEANAELILLISRWLDISKSCVEILSGHVSRHKRLIIKGMSLANVQEKIPEDNKKNPDGKDWKDR